MDHFALIGGLAGGVGLFLLGMGLMTDGLKLAAGPALEHILARFTQTRLRGLASGIAVTALVQSSSAVTVAAIGFVNAGLLTFAQSMWVLFGANVGTTMTGWIVALAGLKFKIEALALPLIGVGMILRLTGEATRRGALGLALAGFGVLFLGIDMLKDSFTGLADGFRLPEGEGAFDVVGQVLIGVALTVLMQSSSAALAIALTAAQGGLIGAQGAAAVVIGANIGTTVTALIAALGATANAKRAAAAHILFNLLTGAVALLLLPWLIGLIATLREWLELENSPAAKLALFHTVFNILGVLLIWPLAGRLSGFLLARFKSAEEDTARPRHLDKTVLAVPQLALDALERELRRLGGIAVATVRDAFAAPPPPLEKNRIVADRLSAAIAAFIAELNRGGMSADSARRLPQLLRVARYYEAAAEHASEAARALREVDVAVTTETPAMADFRAQGEALLTEIDPAEAGSAMADRNAFEDAYQRLKAELLEAGATARLPVAAMDARLRGASALRRAVEQVGKATGLLPSMPSEIFHAANDK